MNVGDRVRVRLDTGFDPRPKDGSSHHAGRFGTIVEDIQGDNSWHDWGVRYDDSSDDALPARFAQHELEPA